MKPVEQTRFGSPGGNCLQACLASVLELPLDDVPDFCNEHPGEDEDASRWIKELAAWLEGYELTCLVANMHEGILPWWTTLYWIAGGKTHRRGYHSVVYKGQELAHDPHPDKVGLKAVEDAVLLLPLDAAKWATL